MTDLPIELWTEWARRDDWHQRFVGSDIRQMLGEIQRLREAAKNLPAQPQTGQAWRIEHDGFEGNQIGSYVTREGKRGVVLQQIGTRVVHVYGEKWLTCPLPRPNQPQENGK